MRTRFYTYNGHTKVLAEWCREFDIPYLTAFMRIKRGLSFEEAMMAERYFRRPNRKAADRDRMITIDGRTQSLHKWCVERGLTYNKVLKRVLRGWDPIDALTKESNPGFAADKARKKVEADFIGQRFGRLVVNGFSHSEDQHRWWSCTCDCGKQHVVTSHALTSGHTRSCGCLREDFAAAGGPNKKHGKAKTTIHNTWLNMRARCQDPANPGYVNYGGRGIKVCDRWEVFENFYADMGDPPPNHSLERVNNDGDYTPDNCVWATRHEQSRNKRTNVWVTIDGETKLLSDWCKHYGISLGAVHTRLKKGWPIECALMEPKADRFR